MISRIRSWIRARSLGTKLLLGGAVAVAALSLLYVAARTVQYTAASRISAGLFVPEGAQVVVRVSDLSDRWAAVQKTELWKSFTRRLQKDPGIRSSLNEILGSAGAPTLDQLEDRRWLERNPLLSEPSILRFAGRDVAFSSIGDKICVATRIGLRDYLLLPALQLFPGAAGAQRAEAGGSTVLKRGDFFIAIQGAIVVVSNDAPMLASALQRRGSPEAPTGLLRATLMAEPIRPVLRGFPLGGVFAIADVDSCERIDLDIVIEGADLVVRAKAEGLKPRREEPAPVDTVRMIPANGLGACVTNVELAPFWEWARRIGDRRARGGTPFDKFARDNFSELVEVLHSQRFGEEVGAKLDGPVSIIFGASEGEDGRTYAAIALYLRSSQPREAAEALQGVVDRATENVKDGYKSRDAEAGGVSYRTFRSHSAIAGVNNYLALSYAATGDALIIANHPAILEDVLKCRANEGPMMAVQLHYEQAMRRLQELGLKKVMTPGAAAGLFLYGPAIRQGLEGFYATLASKIVDTPRNKDLLRPELAATAAKEGQPLSLDDLDVLVRRVLDERTREMEMLLRSRARILDYLKWIAVQAEAVSGGMKLEFAIELK
jgi:hypothetical protein